MEESTYLKDAIKLIEEERFSEAKGLLLSFISQNENESKIYLLLGTVNFHLNEFEQAEGNFNKYIERCPNDPKGYFNKGLIFERKGNISEAIKAFEKVIVISPNYQNALLKLKKYSNKANFTTLADKIEVGNSEYNLQGDLILQKNRFGKTYAIEIYKLLLGTLFMLVFFALDYFFLFIDGWINPPLAVFHIPVILLLINLIDMSLNINKESYSIYTHRIDIYKSGLIHSSMNSVWTHQIEDVALVQPFPLQFFDEYCIKIKSKEKYFLIIGLGDKDFMEKFYNELQKKVLLERRGMKKWWI